MSSTSSKTVAHDESSNVQNSDVMTPNEKKPKVSQRHKNGVSDDDDDVVLGKVENLTNHTYTSILAPTSSTSDVLLHRDQLSSYDVILGRGGYDNGPYAEALKDWWPQYEAGTHSSKRIVCRDAIRDMHSRGVRFLNRIEDGSRDGCYTIEPKGSARVERKVLRSLRQEVLNCTVRSEYSKEMESIPVVVPLPIIGIDQPEKEKSPLKEKTPKKARPVKAKAKRTNKSSIPAKVNIKKQVTAVASYRIAANSKYIPILPASLRPQENIKIVAPPSLVLPPSIDIIVPPAMRMNTSLGSVTGTSKESSLPLIPSAVNFGTSDLATKAPRNKDALFTQPQVFAASPDTVLTTDYLSFLNSSFGMGTTHQGKEPKNKQYAHQPSLQSNPSFDFKAVFDDTAVENVMNDVDASICPPVLTGRQSSMFSAVSFKEWSLNQKDKDSTMFHMHSAVIPAVVPEGPNTHDDLVNTFNVKMTKSFDRNTIFDDDMMPASPTGMYYNITSEVENFVHGTMPYITPQNKGNSPESRNMKTPTRSNAKRNISDEYETADACAYHELCHKLEDSMAKLEDEEMQHKSWETHNEGLWRHFIQEQPDLAKMLLSRSGRNSSSYESPCPTTTVQLPPRPTNRTGGGSSASCGSMTLDSRNTSPVPWWFYHDSAASDNSCSGHQSVSMKWQQLFANESEENWEEV